MKFEINPTGKRGRSAWPLFKRLESQFERTGKDECWPWRGAASNLGYGVIRISGRGYQAYRVIYELERGDIPDGLVLDHLCCNPRCVNPYHMEPVTQRLNILRGRSPAAEHARKSHCPKGHAYSGENLFVAPNGARQCRTCRRAADANYKERKRANA